MKKIGTPDFTIVLTKRPGAIALIAPAAVSLLVMGGCGRKSGEGEETPAARTVTISDFRKPKHFGYQWDAADNAIFDSTGLAVELDTTYHKETMEMTLANTASYTLYFLRDGQKAAETVLEQYEFANKQKGMWVYNVDPPSGAGESGYNTMIFRVRGTGKGSLGHIEHRKPVQLPLKRELRLSEILERRWHGARWDDPKHYRIDGEGATVVLDCVYHSALIEITLANTVKHEIAYYNGDERLAAVTVNNWQWKDGKKAMWLHHIQAPPPVWKKGYTKLIITALDGGTGSLGHIEYKHPWSSYRDFKYYSNLHFKGTERIVIDPSLPVDSLAN